MNGRGAIASVEYLPLSDESVDMIFTDPPYSREYIHTYGWLAREAMRALKPGGFVLAMAGSYYLDQVMKQMSEHLSYFWVFDLRMGNSTVIWPRRIIARSKPLLCFCKGKGLPNTNVLDAIEPGGMDKRFHAWGQDVASARYYVDCFSKPGDLICDPFIGGGTTAVACELISRRCVYFDIDSAAVETTRARLASLYLPEQVGMFQLAPQLEAA